MIHTVDPRQNRLFDPFQGVIPPSGQRIIAEGWQGVFRHALLEVMPVGELAENFSRELDAPTKGAESGRDHPLSGTKETWLAPSDSLAPSVSQDWVRFA